MWHCVAFPVPRVPGWQGTSTVLRHSRSSSIGRVLRISNDSSKHISAQEIDVAYCTIIAWNRSAWDFITSFWNVNKTRKQSKATRCLPLYLLFFVTATNGYCPSKLVSFIASKMNAARSTYVTDPGPTGAV